MQFVKLSTGYYRDIAVATLDDAAEVLFTRGLAYCGEQPDAHGFIPDAILPSLVRKPSPARCRKLAQTLVAADLWVKARGGYRIRSWGHWQEQLDVLADRRRKDRDRKAAERSRPRTVRGQDREMSHDESTDVTGGEIEKERESAAAASDVRGHVVTELPPPLLDLKDRLNSARLPVRWDKLTTVQVAEIERLLEIHGPARLVKSAQDQWQKDNPPAWAQAWLAGWEQLPTTATVKRSRCPEHDVDLPCGPCRSEAIAHPDEIGARP